MHKRIRSSQIIGEGLGPGRIRLRRRGGSARGEFA